MRHYKPKWSKDEVKNHENQNKPLQAKRKFSWNQNKVFWSKIRQNKPNLSWKLKQDIETKKKKRQNKPNFMLKNKNKDIRNKNKANQAKSWKTKMGYYETKGGKMSQIYHDYLKLDKQISILELSSNMHMFYAFGNHIYSFSLMTT